MQVVSYSLKSTESASSTSSLLRIFCSQLEAPDMLNKIAMQCEIMRLQWIWLRLDCSDEKLQVFWMSGVVVQRVVEVNNGGMELRRAFRPQPRDFWKERMKGKPSLLVKSMA